VLWETREGGRELGRLPELDARDAAFAADGAVVAVRTGGDMLYRWDPWSGALDRMADQVRVLGVSSDAEVAVGGDDALFHWDLASGDAVGSIRPFKQARRGGLALARDGSTLLCGAHETGIALFDLGTRELSMAWTRPDAGDDLVNAVALSADGKIAVAATNLLSLTVRRTTDGAVLRHLSGHTESVRSVALSADGAIALSGSTDHQVIVWDMRSGEFIRRLEGHEDPVLAVALSEDGRVALSGGEDAVAVAWDTTSGESLFRYSGHLGQVNAVALAADGARGAAASADGTISVCDLSDGSWRVLTGHEEPVLSVAFSPCGTMLISGAADGTALAWDLASGQPVRRWSGLAAGVTAAACGTDACGMIAVLGAGDGRITWYRLHTLSELLAWAHGARLPRELSCAERGTFLMEPGCDEYGNRVPLSPPPQVPPSPPARPVPSAITLSHPCLQLPPGDSRFDAVQSGRTREWQVTVPPGTTSTFLMVAGGIDLEPRLALHNPDGGPALAVANPGADRRSRLGPVAPGTYRLIADGLSHSGGGYRLTHQSHPPTGAGGP
jgi:WD40 repeat protein